MKMHKGVLLVLVLAVVAACRPSGSGPSGSGRFTDRQLQEVRFPADLGPDSIDVSRYTPEHQAAYTVFADKCSRCHSLARAINAPLITEADWTRFVYRMHGRSQEKFEEPLLTEAEAKKVISFLAYDAHERKAKRATEFVRNQKNLKEEYEELQAERFQAQMKDGQEKARETAPYVGDKP
jgi:hypothetical protein